MMLLPKEAGGASTSADVSNHRPLLRRSAPMEIPKGLPVVAGLAGAIDLRTSAAGDRVEGVLKKPIRDREGTLLFTTGTPLRGRVMRMEQRWLPAHYFVLELKFDEIEIKGNWIPISLDWQPNKPDLDTDGPFPPRWAEIGPYPIERRLGFGTFLFNNKRALVPGPKLQSRWITK